MIASVCIIIVTILCIAHFYLKGTTLRSFATVIASVVAVLASFGYYETASDLLISSGYGGQWVQPVIFAFIFFAVFASVKSLSDFLLPVSIDFGQLSARIAGVVCGSIVGVIISGVLFTGLAMSPLSAKWPYARFEATNINPADPKGSLLNSDSIVAALFSWLSKGSMSSGKSFSVYHAKFINQLHLNRCKADEGVYTISAADSVILPDKYGVRTIEIGERSYTVVRMGVRGDEISRGGAKDKEGRVSFTPSQVRILCKQKVESVDMTGSAEPLYPEAQLGAGNELISLDLDETIDIARGQFESYPGYGTVAWTDLVFSVPSNMIPVLLEFKQNAVIPLPKPVAATDEIEALQVPERQEEEGEEGEEEEEY
jgi:hypothetical protein